MSAIPGTVVTYDVRRAWHLALSNNFHPGKWFGWRAAWGEIPSWESPGPLANRCWCWTLTLFGVGLCFQVDRIVTIHSVQS